MAETLIYSCPFIPAEWIAAHGLRPSRIMPPHPQDRTAGAGVCPYAWAFTRAAVLETDAAGIVVTTTCDQMRRISERIARDSRAPLFLFHVPTTWQTANAVQLYLDELRRLGRFLVELGGEGPDDRKLADVMMDYDARRAELRAARGSLSPRHYTEAVARFHRDGVLDLSRTSNDNQGTASRCGRHPLAPQEGGTPPDRRISRSGVPHSTRRQASWGCDPDARNGADTGIAEPKLRLPDSPLARQQTGAADPHAVPVALVGGPMMQESLEIFDLVGRAGGTVVLDGTTSGERTLPAPFDRRSLQADPLLALADAYFGAIPDAFRRPNSLLYQWLRDEIESREVKGIIFRSYAWCDTWHAEAQRMKEWAPVPLLALTSGDRGHVDGHATSRIESFIEMLR